MDSLFLCKCFLLGVSAASAVGPIFILTFNRGAVYGFTRGFLTAIGAALGDALLLFLGMAGILNIFEESGRYHMLIDVIGGGLLLLIGVSLVLPKKVEVPVVALSADTFLVSIIKPFLSTIFNPLTLLFFIFVSAQIVPAGAVRYPISGLLIGSLFTGLGSLSVLTLVAYVASSIGKVINTSMLRVVSLITGLIMFAIGGYFFFDALWMLFQTRFRV